MNRLKKIDWIDLPNISQYFMIYEILNFPWLLNSLLFFPLEMVDTHFNVD